MRFLLLAALLVGEVQAADVDTRKFSGVVFDAATPGQESMGTDPVKPL